MSINIDKEIIEVIETRLGRAGRPLVTVALWLSLALFILFCLATIWHIVAPPTSQAVQWLLNTRSSPPSWQTILASVVALLATAVASAALARLVMIQVVRRISRLSERLAHTTSEAEAVLKEAEEVLNDPYVGKLSFSEFPGAKKLADELDGRTVAAKMFRELPEPRYLRDQTFSTTTAVRKCLKLYHGDDLTINSLVSPQIINAFFDRLDAIETQIKKFLYPRQMIGAPGSFTAQTVPGMIKWLDSLDRNVASNLAPDLPAVV